MKSVIYQPRTPIRRKRMSAYIIVDVTVTDPKTYQGLREARPGNG